MDILAAYREAGSYRGAAAICGTTHETVRRGWSVTTPVVRLGRARSGSATTSISAARDACQHAEAALGHAVDRARQAGHPWGAVAAVLAISRQAAWQRFAGSQR
jgi:hypothetical protein